MGLCTGALVICQAELSRDPDRDAPFSLAELDVFFERVQAISEEWKSEVKR